LASYWIRDITSLVSQIIRASGGKVGPQAVNDLLKKKFGL
jgi:Asp-tRNA(Asn)/Glu-tRNA(Gln) amidotransferase B subunit